MLEQTWDYYGYFINLFDEEWDGDDSEESELIVLYPILRSRFEQFSEDRLYDVFELYADRDLVLRELMYLDKEARQNLLDSL